MKDTENKKKTYSAPRVTVQDVELCSLLTVSINSFDKGGSEEIRGEESLSKRNDTSWGVGTWDEDVEWDTHKE